MVAQNSSDNSGGWALNDNNAKAYFQPLPPADSFNKNRLEGFYKEQEPSSGVIGESSSIPDDMIQDQWGNINARGASSKKSKNKPYNEGRLMGDPSEQFEEPFPKPNAKPMPEQNIPFPHQKYAERVQKAGQAVQYLAKVATLTGDVVSVATWGGCFLELNRMLHVLNGRPLNVAEQNRLSEIERLVYNALNIIQAQAPAGAPGAGGLPQPGGPAGAPPGAGGLPQPGGPAGAPPGALVPVGGGPAGAPPGALVPVGGGPAGAPPGALPVGGGPAGAPPEALVPVGGLQMGAFGGYDENGNYIPRRLEPRPVLPAIEILNEDDEVIDVVPQNDEYGFFHPHDDDDERRHDERIRRRALTDEMIRTLRAETAENQRNRQNQLLDLLEAPNEEVVLEEGKRDDDLNYEYADEEVEYLEEEGDYSNPGKNPYIKIVSAMKVADTGKHPGISSDLITKYRQEFLDDGVLFPSEVPTGKRAFLDFLLNRWDADDEIALTILKKMIKEYQKKNPAVKQKRIT
ncbi:MAG: hypothetical protein RL498_395, partial [Pseudomonadota bacterium]